MSWCSIHRIFAGACVFGDGLMFIATKRGASRRVSFPATLDSS